MTFIEKYNHLFTDLEAFGKFYPAKFNNNTTIEELREYGKQCLKSQLPIIIGHGKSILTDINRCNNIHEQLIY